MVDSRIGGMLFSCLYIAGIKATILAKIIVDNARRNRNTCLAQYIRAKTAIFNSPPPGFNVDSL
jgi:hypothetical protein